MTKQKAPEIGSLEHAREVVQAVGDRYFSRFPQEVEIAVNLLSNVSTQYDYPYTNVLLNSTGTGVVVGTSKYNPADAKLGQPFNKKSGYCIALSRAARQYIKRFV